MLDMKADFDYEADFMRTKHRLSRKIHKNCQDVLFQQKWNQDQLCGRVSEAEKVLPEHKSCLDEVDWFADGMVTTDKSAQLRHEIEQLKQAEQQTGEELNENIAAFNYQQNQFDTADIVEREMIRIQILDRYKNYIKQLPEEQVKKSALAAYMINDPQSRFTEIVRARLEFQKELEHNGVNELMNDKLQYTQLMLKKLQEEYAMNTESMIKSSAINRSSLQDLSDSLAKMKDNNSKHDQLFEAIRKEVRLIRESKKNQSLKSSQSK